MEGEKGEKKWDNCNSIINKVYFKKQSIGKNINKISPRKKRKIFKLGTRQTYFTCIHTDTQKNDQ